MSIAPSRIARTMAAALWPDVQYQRQCAPGVYGFSCAGHGGVVAVLGTADLPAPLVDIARERGLIELVAVVKNGRRTKTYTSEKYKADSLRELAARSPEHVELFEVWVGEEDCNWATILYAGGPPLLEAAIRAGYLSPGCDMADVRGCLERWNADYLARVDALEAVVS